MVLLLQVTCSHHGQSLPNFVTDVCVIIEDEDPGQWTGSVTLGPFTEAVSQWTIILGFDSASVDWVESVVGEVTGSGASWSLASKEWDSDLSPGDTLEVKFIVGYSANKVRTRPEVALMPCHKMKIEPTSHSIPQLMTNVFLSLKLRQ